MSDASPEIRTVNAETADAGMRLDKFLASRHPDLSRSRLRQLIEQGHVRTPDATVRDASERVKPGAVYALAVPPPEPAEPAGENIALAVVYEDASVIVIDKPAGLVVHPAAGHASGTLVNALIAHCGDSLSGIGGVRRPGIVHRLDKDTSGLMVVAKTDAAHQHLAAQFAAHGRDGRMARAYLAVVWNCPTPAVGRIEAALGRKATNRMKIAVVRDDSVFGRAAATRYEVIQRFGSAEKPVASLVRCALETGRTHQVRVHMAHIGHPLLGDVAYGAGFSASAGKLPPQAREALSMLGRQALHAAHLAFEHPKTGRLVTFDSGLPPELAALVAALEKI